MNNIEIPAQFSALFGMGTPIRLYLVKKTTKYVNAFLGVLFLLAAAALFLFGAYYTYDLISTHGSAMLWSTFAPFLIGSVVVGLLGLWMVWSAFSNWKKALMIYQNGFAYSDRKGVTNWNWQDVASIKAAVTKHYTNGIYTGTTHIYTIENRTGEKIMVNDSITKVEEAAKDLRSNVFPILYQSFSQAYNSGQPVCFGPVTLSRTSGILIGKKSYTWDQVKKVSISNGMISVAKKDGGWFSGAAVQASSVPNLEVMLSIVDQVVGINAKG